MFWIVVLDIIVTVNLHASPNVCNDFMFIYLLFNYHHFFFFLSMYCRIQILCILFCFSFLLAVPSYVYVCFRTYCKLSLTVCFVWWPNAPKVFFASIHVRIVDFFSFAVAFMFIEVAYHVLEILPFTKAQQSKKYGRKKNANGVVWI